MNYKKASELLHGDSVLFSEMGGGVLQVLPVASCESICNGTMAEITLDSSHGRVVRILGNNAIVAVVEEYEWKE